MRTLRILIAGCGYVGTALGKRLAVEGHLVWGLRRSPKALPDDIHPLAADLCTPTTLQILPPALDVIFYMAGASNTSDDAYRSTYVDGLRNLLDTLQEQQQHPRRIFMTSSTGVYAQRDGQWVDEASAARPQHATGQCLIEGERLLFASPFPATVLRLAGIYGPGRTRLIDKVRQGEAVYQEHPPRYTNRIHRDDCVGALRYLMLLARPASLYLGVDYRPIEEGTVLRWLAAQLAVPPPREQQGNPNPLHSNKRCRNTRLVASGYVFRYPTFQQGYSALLADPAGSPIA